MEGFTLLLEKLAEQFGTTVEHLWGVMVFQAHISAISSSIVVVIWCVTCAFIVKFVHKQTTDTKGKDGSTISAEWKDESVFLAWLVVAVIVCITIFVASIGFRDIVTAVFNPEYWALMKLKD